MNNSKLKALDFVNIGAILLTVAGLVMDIVGGAVLSPAVGIGPNTNLSPVMIVGMVLIVLGLAVAIYGSVITESKQLNKIISSVAIYLAVAAVMFAIVFLALTIVWPVLHPTNG